MDKGENYEVKDLKLAEQGRKNIEWAEMHMGALMKVKERFEKEKLKDADLIIDSLNELKI